MLMEEGSALLSFGANRRGQLGLGGGLGFESRPRLVPALSPAAARARFSPIFLPLR